MGLGGNSCMLLSLAIDTHYRRISTVLKDRKHSSRSTYRDRSLLHLLILRVMQVPISFFPKGRNGDRNALMNFDTFHERQFKVAARTMNTRVFHLVSPLLYFYPMKIVFGRLAKELKRPTLRRIVTNPIYYRVPRKKRVNGVYIYISFISFFYVEPTTRFKYREIKSEIEFRWNVYIANISF